MLPFSASQQVAFLYIHSLQYRLPKASFKRQSVSLVVAVMVFLPAGQYVKKMLILITLFRRKQLG